MLDPALGIPSEAVRRRAVTDSGFGCPHCIRAGTCDRCLWTTALNADSQCTDWPFFTPTYGNVCLDDVEWIRQSDGSHAGITYSAGGENIKMLAHALEPDVYGIMKEFLEAHVIWAAFPQWGCGQRRKNT